MPLTLGLVVLLLWNGFLAANNRTTIEYHEGVRANVLVSPAQSLSCACCGMQRLVMVGDA